MMRFTVTKRASHHVSQTAANYTCMHLPLTGTLSIPGLQWGEMLYKVGRPAAPTVSGGGVNHNNLVQISGFWWAQTTAASLSPLKITNYTPSTCDDDVGSIPITLSLYKWGWMTVSSGSQSFFYSILFKKKSVAEKGKVPPWIPQHPISICL